MTRITTLLAARDPTVINDIQRLHDETEDARLEVCGRLDRVVSRLGHRTLLLIHLEPGTDLSATQTYRLPTDLPALRELLARLHTDTALVPATSSAEPVDPLTAAMIQC